MGADDRPTERDEDSNRKSLFPATKTLHISLYRLLTVEPHDLISSSLLSECICECVQKQKSEI